MNYERLPWRLAVWIAWALVVLPAMVVAAFLGWRYVLGIVSGFVLAAGAEFIAHLKQEHESADA
jgi:hypothetical protein